MSFRFMTMEVLTTDPVNRLHFIEQVSMYNSCFHFQNQMYT